MDPLVRLAHVAALAVYGGTTLALLTMVLPAAADTEDTAQQRRILTPALIAYNIASIGALGVLIMTGATSLTGLKASFGTGYASLVWPLVHKLTLTFLLTMVGTYLSFGIAHRIVRAERLGDPIDPERFASMLRRLRSGAWLAVALTLWTTWVGLDLTRRAAESAARVAITTPG